MNPEELLNAFRKATKRYAEAKATADYLDLYRRPLLAAQMRDAEARGHKTIAAQEREAYASEAYLQHIEALRQAQIDAANAAGARHECELAIEIWRTRQADERAERKGYGA